MISGGLITILLAIIAGLFFSDGSAGLPNWAENVLISIATACGLKLGDCLAALVALASGRQMDAAVQKLAVSQPTRPPASQNAADGAQQAAEAAGEVAEQLESETRDD